MDADKNDAFDGNLSIPEVLRRLRHRLLDLTARNRLLNFKVTAGKALSLVPGRLDETFRRLTGANLGTVQIMPVPDPDRDQWTVKHDRMVKPEPKEHAVRLGLNIELEETPVDWDDAKIARALHYNEDLAKHFRKLDREARLALEETGANMLYLVLGCLDYTENPGSDKVFSAPLVCVPVKLTAAQQRQQVLFNLAHTGEEIQENLSLTERLKRDHTFTLPEFPQEDDGIEVYFQKVEKLIERRPLWKVRRNMTLALLSFGNMLLIRDLDPENWVSEEGESTLLNHAVIQRIFTGGNEAVGQGYAEEYDLDNLPAADLPLIFDADSSQHSAIVDVMSGKSLVIEGPPGTGKSQTITNIIAACLNAGKSVLFMAEKLTALQVVQRRLQAAGLDPFLLELHSNKTNKRQVLEALESRLDLRTASPPGLQATIERLTDRKQKLDQYAKLLNTKTGNHLGLTIHQVLWRAEQHRVKLGGETEKLIGVAVNGAPQSNAANLEKQRSHVASLAQVFKDIGCYDASSPFWGFFPDSLAPGDDLAIERIFKKAQKHAEAAKTTSEELAEIYGLREDDPKGLANPTEARQTIERLEALLAGDTAVDVVPAIFGKNRSNQESALHILKKHNGILQSIFQLEAATAGKVDYGKAERSYLTEAALCFVRDNGVGGLRVGALDETIQRLDDLLNAATSARQGLNQVLESAGIEQNAIGGDEKLRAILDVCAAAPLSHLHMRSEKLAKPNAVEILNKGNVERIRLQTTEETVAQRFYTDQEPSEAELRDWILALREGDAWFRIFQKSWRAAIKAHRSLSREKDKIPVSQRLAELEEWWDLRKGWSAWFNSEPLSRTASVSPLPLDFPLMDAAKVARWLKDADERLTQANVDEITFDPMTVERTVVAGHAGRQAEISAKLAVLGELDGWIKILFPRLQGWGDTNWSQRLAVSSRLLEQLRVVLNDFAGAIHADETLEKGFALVRDTQVLFAKSNEIAGSVDLKRLLGARAATFREDLPAIMAAVRFGQAVFDSDLPLQGKQKACTPSARLVLEDMRQRVSAFAEHSDRSRAALRELEQFGSLEIDLWMPASSSDETGSEQACNYIIVALEHTAGLIPWSLYVHYRAECGGAGLGAFITALEEQDFPPDLMLDGFLYRFYASIAEVLFRKTPALQNFSGSVHTNTRSEYSELDRNIMALRGKQISHQNQSSTKTMSGNTGARVADKTEMNLIQHLLPQARPRIALRELLRRAGKSIQQLKPCFMMGPQAVAQYLHAEPEMFDVVIMDEASQMRPEQAIGAIVRGKQLVVVGDPKQLPPTSFFSRMQVDGDSQTTAVAEEAESILDLASSHFRPIRSLRWHYRSRHESLIAFSNKKFYDGKLIVFPSPFPRSRGLGVRSHYIKSAVYESQTNAREASAVVDAVVDHILHEPELSLGVVALNIRQRDLIAELLEERLKSVPGAEEYRNKWNDEGQDIFVKNLENVQGDERDTIVISTTYGPPPGAARVHQNFGPISQDGGWRRLNVLFTRARSSVLLVTSMKHTDIVVGAGTPSGTRALRDYLLYAESGRLNHDHGEATGAQPESEFEVSVIQALQERGYDCVPQVGVANFRIDIGVRHPQYPHLFLAAIECDGATYHSGITVRDRDRIRQEILESMGWHGKIWRIWSTEWFRNPKREMSRLVSFLEDLKKQEVDPSLAAFVDVQSANSEEDLPDPTPDQLSRANATLDQLLTEDSRPEVDVGDHVVYRNLSSGTPGQETTALIARDRFDPNNGIISEASPLGQALIGATEGEEVPFSTPGRPNQTLLIVAIKRAGG